MSATDRFPSVSTAISTLGTSWSEMSSELRQSLRRTVSPSQPPQGWIAPASVTELAEVVQAGHQHQWHLGVCGRASKVDWGNPLDPIDVVVSTQHLTQLVAHAASDLTVTVQTGCQFQDLQQHLTQSGQWWPVNPLYPNTATVGGILATADTGSYRHRYGSVRDLLLGIQFIRHDGEIAKAGGRVVKNVAGYDLMKLMTGSYGSLGILTEVTLRLYPQSETQQLVVCAGAASSVDELRRQILDSTLTPAGLDVVSPTILQQMSTGSGAADQLGLVVEVHGLEGSVAAQVEQVKAWAGSLSMQVMEGSSDTYSQTVATLLGTPDNSFLAKLGIPSNRCVGVAVDLLKKYPDSLLQIHAGSGVGRWRLPTPTMAPADIYTLRSQFQDPGGYLIVLEAPLDFKQRIDPWGYAPSVVTLMTQLKHQFDPALRLNPGKLGLK